MLLKAVQNNESRPSFRPQKWGRSLISTIVNVKLTSVKSFLTWLEQQNYYDVHEGAVESQNYVG